MNEQTASLIRAARGPLILITVGVLFAIDRFTPLRFSQTWPVLLIVIGVLRLLGGSRRDRLVGPQTPPPPPPAPPYDPSGGRP
jgi:hypothetical protein